MSSGCRAPFAASGKKFNTPPCSYAANGPHSRVDTAGPATVRVFGCACAGYPGMGVACTRTEVLPAVLALVAHALTVVQARGIRQGQATFFPSQACLHHPPVRLNDRTQPATHVRRLGLRVREQRRHALGSASFAACSHPLPIWRRWLASGTPGHIRSLQSPARSPRTAVKKAWGMPPPPPGHI